MSPTMPAVRRSLAEANMPTPGTSTTRGRGSPSEAPAARRRLGARHPRAAEEPSSPFPLADGLFGARDQLDRRLVGLAHGGTPRDRAVALEQQCPGVGPLADRVGHVA